jgi:hypothetical protein
MVAVTVGRITDAGELALRGGQFERVRINRLRKGFLQGRASGADVFSRERCLQERHRTATSTASPVFTAPDICLGRIGHKTSQTNYNPAITKRRT